MDVKNEAISHSERTVEVKMTVVTALMSTVVFNESLDSIKDSDFYNNNLKKAGKRFEFQIVNNCNKMVDHLWECNEVASSDLTSAIRDIADHISSLKPSEIVAISQAMKKGLINFT